MAAITLSISFQNATDKFTKSLTAQQRQEFAACSLDDVRQSIVNIQEKRGNQKIMRNMARIQAFLEAMDQYRKVVESFLNCTPFLGYVWVANTWVDSLDTILNAYKDIGERLPSFVQYEGFFEKNLEIRRALELYYCDILEFHYHALHFLSRPGWKRLFTSSWKTFETQFRHILDSLNRHKDLLESEKGTVAVFEAQRIRELAETHIKEMSELERKKQLALVMEKLNAPDYQWDQYLASGQRRGSQSGMWVLQDERFLVWSEVDTHSNPLLYVHGIPGSGKTILASLIIETLQQRKPGAVLFFYCKHNQPQKNTFIGILRGLLAQMLGADSALLSHMYEICSSKDQVGLSTMLENLAGIAFDTQATPFVILDGLDECGPGEAEKALSWFLSRQKDTNQGVSGHLRLLCVGQRIEVLQRLLSSAVNISLENASHEGDIKRYVQEQACSIKKEFEISSETEAVIVKRVTNAAKSMFLFAKLVMENLSNQTSQYEVVKELEPETFPVNLRDAYERIVSTVFKQGAQGAAAISIIGRVACAVRPLRWREIQATFFIDPKMGSCDYQGRRLRKSCKKLCGSLVDLQMTKSELETEAILHLVHDTARDYLLHEGLINFSLEHAKMALFCAEYLLSYPFNALQEIRDLKEDIKDGYYAFQDYAVSHWYDHMTSSIKTAGEGSTDIHKQMNLHLKLFLEDYGTSEKRKSCLQAGEFSNVTEIFNYIPQDVSAWSQWFELEWRTSRIRNVIESVKDDDNSDDVTRNIMQQIYGTKLFKCPKLQCIHFTTGFDSKLLRDEHLNRHNRPFICVEQHCPFQALGFETKVQLESHRTRNHVEDDADQFAFPHRPKGDNLFKACIRGDVTAVKSFIDDGADINSTSLPKGGKTPLLLAARNSHLNICKILVDNGVNVNFQGPLGLSTALHAATSLGDIDMVHYFLSQSDILPDIRDRGNQTLLMIAVKKREKPMIELLLATNKVDPNAKDKLDKGRTPLMIAVQQGDEAIVRLLLTTDGVDPEAKDDIGRTPLMAAVQQGDETIVRLLLTTDRVNLEAKNNIGRTPLMAAVQQGYEAIVRLLLATDRVDPEAKDDIGRTPLSEAAKVGEKAIFELLLSTKICCD